MPIQRNKYTEKIVSIQVQAAKRGCSFGSTDTNITRQAETV